MWLVIIKCYNNLTVVRFDSFKQSLLEDAQLIRCFPALGTFVLELTPLTQWDAMEIAGNIPTDQCLLALSGHVKDVSEDAEQVGGT